MSRVANESCDGVDSGVSTGQVDILDRISIQFETLI